MSGTSGRVQALGMVRGEPRDMAKAGLPESQSPEGAPDAAGKTPVTGAALRPDDEEPAVIFPGPERCPVRVFKETDGTLKSRLTRAAVVDMGLP